MEDLEDAWDFVKKEHLDSDDEEEEMTPGLKELKELDVGDVDKANNALKAHVFIVAELKRKIEHELYMAEAAAIAGWGTVSVMENKMYDNISGANAAEKEQKTQKIRKATETYAKEQRLHRKGEPSNGPFKPKKRPSYLHGSSFKKFAGGHLKFRKSGGLRWLRWHGCGCRGAWRLWAELRRWPRRRLREWREPQGAWRLQGSRRFQGRQQADQSLPQVSTLVKINK